MFFAKVFVVVLLISLALAHPQYQQHKEAQSYSNLKHDIDQHNVKPKVYRDHHHEDKDLHDEHPQYKYEYGIKDEKTGDSKDAWETRDGDKVRGSYSFQEADGRKRTVEYTSDAKNGFNAEVKHTGVAKPAPEAPRHHY